MESSIEEVVDLFNKLQWKSPSKVAEFIDRFYLLAKSNLKSVPNLKSTFQKKSIDKILFHLVKQIITSNTNYDITVIINFFVDCVYEDEPEFNENGDAILLKTTPIHLAAEHNKREVARELFRIYRRFDNYINKSGLTHFIIACKFGLEDEVFKFIALGQDVNSIYPETGDSLLALSLKTKHMNVFEILLINGADPHRTDNAGFNILHYVCENEKYDILLTFFDIMERQKREIHINARTKDGRTALMLSVIRQDKEMVNFLLKKKSLIHIKNNEGETILHIISKTSEDNDEILKCIMNVMEMPVNFINEPDRHSNTALHLACMLDCLIITKLLLSLGADPSLRNNEEHTIVHIISLHSPDDTELLQLVLSENQYKKSLKIDTRDKVGNRPIHLALKTEQRGIAMILVAKGADVNSVNKDGSSPLHMICQAKNYNDEEDEETLVDFFFQLCSRYQKQIDVNAIDESGRTSLHWAIENLMPRTVETLRRHDAKLKVFQFSTALTHRFQTDEHETLKLQAIQVVCGSIGVLESLKKFNYKVSLRDYYTVMKLFQKLHVFNMRQMNLYQAIKKKEEIRNIAKKYMIRPSVSLYSIMQQSDPENIELDYKDYLYLANNLKFPDDFRQAAVVSMVKKWVQLYPILVRTCK
ncbi:uncharacterized protein LOC111694286 [Trichogramma pretiosum]|uniref:uncharacterized protein LOC111694286 n=1 Tax=Trichogramma pretiosum TaxID=7493 RepID=UPI000C719214|nr:uncharacterized protein LOC111694286 [Trichogramma pretiosum]